MRPPFQITPAIANEVAAIERLVGRYEGMWRPPPTPELRRSTRVRTVKGSLEIEGNTMTEDQVTALLEGKRVVGPARDVLEVRNALAAYEHVHRWKPHLAKHLLQGHRMMMRGLIDSAGHWRKGAAGIAKGTTVTHVAPPASRVAPLMEELLAFVRDDQETHPAIRAAVFHYELEFIHPFEDGNGRLGRLWHTLILGCWEPVFFQVPIESLIRDKQHEYYRVLEQCDQGGNSTDFIEFALEVTRSALAETLVCMAATSMTPNRRLDLAASHFKARDFARKDYLSLFAALSTASASRDLKSGVDQGRLTRTGDKVQARYQFRQ